MVSLSWTRTLHMIINRPEHYPSYPQNGSCHARLYMIMSRGKFMSIAFTLIFTSFLNISRENNKQKKFNATRSYEIKETHSDYPLRFS